MNILNDIFIEEKNQAVAIFYESTTEAIKKGSGAIPEIDTENTQKHCELFSKSNVSSFILNAKSFVIKLKDRSNQGCVTGVKFYIRDQKQVKQLSGLAEYTLGMGLKVVEHYSSFKASKLIKGE